MPSATKQAGQLDRAYVQSRVIETSLHHLTMTLTDVDPELRDAVQSYADRFEQYVRELGDACEQSAPQL